MQLVQCFHIARCVCASAEPLREPDRGCVQGHREDHQPDRAEHAQLAGERLRAHRQPNRCQTASRQVPTATRSSSIACADCGCVRCTVHVVGNFDYCVTSHHTHQQSLTRSLLGRSHPPSQWQSFCARFAKLRHKPTALTLLASCTEQRRKCSSSM